mgnify:CR=1 FL=1
MQDQGAGCDPARAEERLDGEGLGLFSIRERLRQKSGAIRDHGTGKRRPFVRYFACERDLSHEPPETPLPQEIVSGKEPFHIVGAIAGG